MSADWTPTEKEAAIISLLGVIWIHLDLMPMRLKSQRYGDSEVEPKAPLPGWRTLDCDGLCRWETGNPRCEFATSCKGEWWAIVKEKMRRRYRMEAVSRSLDALLREMPQAWRAVIALYVDPYDEKTEPLDDWHKERRMDWARKGIEFMAHEIPGEVVAFGEKKRSTREKVECELARGLRSTVKIAANVGVSERQVRRIIQQVNQEQREMVGV